MGWDYNCASRRYQDKFEDAFLSIGLGITGPWDWQGHLELEPKKIFVPRIAQALDLVIMSDEQEWTVYRHVFYDLNNGRHYLISKRWKNTPKGVVHDYDVESSVLHFLKYKEQFTNSELPEDISSYSNLFFEKVLPAIDEIDSVINKFLREFKT
jgi:hypothetical protein